MNKNFLFTSLRSFKKRKLYTAINIIGLSASITFSYLLWLYTNNELSYDSNYESADMVFRVNADFNMNGKRDIYSNAPRPIGPTLLKDFPEVESQLRIRGLGGLSQHTATLDYNERKVTSTKIFIADSSYFEVFSQTFLMGDAEQALKEVNSIVITESLAKKIFGDENPMGRTVKHIGYRPTSLKVTGVIKDSDAQTHLPVEALVSWVTFPYSREMTQWYGAHVYTYIKLKEGTSISSVQRKVPEFVDTHMKETFEELNGTANLIFQNIQDIHLADPYVWEPYPQGSKTNVKVLQFVMIFLLVFACINYVNMATANSSERAPEVGIRKTLGAPKKLLVAQFLTESVLLAIFSAISALLLSFLFLNVFNNLTDVQLTWRNLTEPGALAVLFLVSFVIGLLAGIYPALYLSSIGITKTLKGKFATGKDGDFLRKVLVTVQYSIAATLITGIFLVFNQIHFIKTKDIGYDKENILVIDVPRDSVVIAKSKSFSDELKNRSDIQGTAFSNYTLDEEANQFTPTLRNLEGGTFSKGADLIVVDHDFINTIGITIVEGRNFRNSSEADEEQSIIVNEAAVESFGWTKDPLKGGMRAGTNDEGVPQFMNVVGVVKDFNLGVSYAEINPLIIFYNSRGGRSIYVKLSSDDIFTSLKEIETLWTSFFPSHEMGYHFVDQDLERLYRREDKFLGLLSFFSITIAIIASLGLIGLISYLTRVKRKEIAIRKVLGSSIKDVMMLLSKRFLWLLLIANSLSIPITYYLITIWLSNFSSRAELSIWPFVFSFLIALVFTAFALAYHIKKAAYENPIHSIKYE